MGHRTDAPFSICCLARRPVLRFATDHGKSCLSLPVSHSNPLSSAHFIEKKRPFIHRENGSLIGAGSYTKKADYLL